jgi:hypothetical protein
VVFRGGHLMLAMTGHEILTGPSLQNRTDALDDENFSAAVAALMTTRAKILIDSIDGVPALESTRVGALAAMRFHSDGRALVFDGLHGPAPMRARQPVAR